MDNYPISAHILGLLFQLDGKQLQDHYKNHLSDFHDWEQKPHAEYWTVFPDNISPRLSIDETSFSNGKLYTIVSSKASKGRKGTIVATVRGTRAEDIIDVLERIPLKLRNRVKEVTMDMAPNMAKAIRRCFRNARRVIDRFHVQNLAYDAVQELRIRYRWHVLDEESKRLLKHVNVVSLMILKYYPTGIPSNSCWQGRDTCCSNTRPNGPRARSIGQSSYSYGSPF